MFIHFDADRPSDSPFIERVWCCHSEAGGRFLSVASTHWEFVVTRLSGDTVITLRGPETGPREVDCPANGEWFAIRFKAGTFMPALPVWRLLNGRDVNLPFAMRGRFRLDSSAWEIPDFDNAEVFVDRLVRRGLLVRDAAVAAFRENGFDVESPKASMYLWVPLPAGIKSLEFHERLMMEEGVIALAGSSLGAGGEGFFRISFITSPERIAEAAERAGRLLARMRR